MGQFFPKVFVEGREGLFIHVRSQTQEAYWLRHGGGGLPGTHPCPVAPGEASPHPRG